MNWEQKIIGAFTDRYFASAPLGGAEERNAIRLRSVSIFPGFDAAPADEKESYLEAAEALEKKGLVNLVWEKRGKGERLKTLGCGDFEKLFEEADRRYPRAEAEEARALLAEKAAELRRRFPRDRTADAEKALDFLDRFSRRFGSREVGRGLGLQKVSDFVRLLEFLFRPQELEKISARALSILLYRDSKYLESLLELFAPLLAGAQKSTAEPGPSSETAEKSSPPDFSFLERSYPETMISGRILCEYRGGAEPLVNAAGLILGFPLESAEALAAVRPLGESLPEGPGNSGESPGAPAVLTIENKETFYALGSPQNSGTGGSRSRYSCFLSTAGYPNRAAAALNRVLSSSGFCFYHAGDLDPDGILILQNVMDIAGRPVLPVRMDAAVFDRYLPWSRPLTKTVLRQMEKIREDTAASPALAGLMRRIEATGRGVEQEIINYRD
ncbi:MAG: DUF2399 domain-containing protein [Treponema sp.]|jgi:hypothetical protein|nr:DUF2399 domain-containing protein [Treponema sp.]